MIQINVSSFWASNQPAILFELPSSAFESHQTRLIVWSRKSGKDIAGKVTELGSGTGGYSSSTSSKAPTVIRAHQQRAENCIFKFLVFKRDAITAMLSGAGKSWQNSPFPPFFSPRAVRSAEDKARSFAQSHWRDLLRIKTPDAGESPAPNNRHLPTHPVLHCQPRATHGSLPIAPGSSSAAGWDPENQRITKVGKDL